MDTINWEGWLPREQILGEEAKSKVPEVIERSCDPLMNSCGDHYRNL